MNLKTKLVAVIGSLALAGGAGAATAAITSSPVDSSGGIHGCYASRATNGSHVFKMQNAGTLCPSGYIAISWNQYGGDQAIEVTKSILVSDSDTNTQEIVEATCPAGYIGTGGGFAALWDATAEQWRLDVSAPGEANPPPGWNLSDGSNSWEVLFDRTGPVGSGTDSTQVAAYVNCSPSHDAGATGPG